MRTIISATPVSLSIPNFKAWILYVLFERFLRDTAVIKVHNSRFGVLENTTEVDLEDTRCESAIESDSSLSLLFVLLSRCDRSLFFPSLFPYLLHRFRW